MCLLSRRHTQHAVLSTPTSQPLCKACPPSAPTAKSRQLSSSSTGKRHREGDMSVGRCACMWVGMNTSRHEGDERQGQGELERGSPLCVQVPEPALPGLVPLPGHHPLVRDAHRLCQCHVPGSSGLLHHTSLLLPQRGAGGAGPHLHCLPGRHVPVLRATQCRG